jgi:hypothetical protein
METSDALPTQQSPDQAARGKQLRRDWAFLAALAVLFLFNLFVFVRFDEKLPAPGVDDADVSWLEVLHWAHLNHIAFGTKLIYTYGPLGFAMIFGFRDVFVEVALAWILLATACFLALARIAWRLRDRPWLGFVWLLATVVLVGVKTGLADIQILLAVWLLLLTYFWIEDRPTDPILNLLAISLAVFGLVKFTFFVASGSIILLITVDQIFRRRIPYTLFVFLAATIVLWFAAGQSLGNFWPYLKYSWIVASGYSEGALISGANDELDIAKFAGTALLLLAILAFALIDSNRNKPGITQRFITAMAGVLFFLFLLFKEGYIRHDIHEVVATMELALMFITGYGAILLRMRSSKAHVALAAVCLWPIYLTFSSQTTNQNTTGPQNLAGEFAAIPANLAAFQQGFATRQISAADSKFPIGVSSPTPLPKIQGTVDVYSWDQRDVLENGLDYDPRPVFQSYLAYTPELLRLNAQFLASPDAPQNILFNVEPLDRRYPSLEDATSWPEILTRYDLVDANGSRLLLHQAPVPRQYSLVPLRSVIVQMHRGVPIPQSDDPVWVTIKVNPTPLGKLTRLFYKPPTILLGIQDSENSFMPFRMEPSIAREGFLLSPRISDRFSFALLYSPQWKKLLAQTLVKQMAVAVTDDLQLGDSAYDQIYSIQFYALKFPHTDVSAVPGIAQYLKLRDLFTHMRIVRCEFAPQLAQTDYGKIGISGSAQSSLLFAIPPGAHKFQFGFGMPISSYSAQDPAGATLFRVYTVSAISGSKIIANVAWTRTLDPAQTQVDRGVFHSWIDLPQGNQSVILEAVPSIGVIHPGGDYYWTDLDFQ